MAKKAKPKEAESPNNNEKKCGIIMPISDMAGYAPGHWIEVNSIISQAILKAGYESDIVSNANETTLIQETIMMNLWECPIIVCDVSGKNANVMLELGIRLTFDKPIVIIKDNATDYTFDIGSIRHIGYPKDLNYHGIVKFKRDLTKAITATVKANSENKNYSPFLKRYKTIKPSKLESTEIPQKEYFQLQIEKLMKSVDDLRSTILTTPMPTKAKVKDSNLILQNRIYKLFDEVTRGWGHIDPIFDSEIKVAIQDVNAMLGSDLAIDFDDLESMFRLYLRRRGFDIHHPKQ